MLKCRSCFSRRIKPLFAKEGFNIYECLNCRLVFSDKSYLENEIQEIYSNKYYENLKNFSEITDQRYATILSSLSQYNKNNRLFDLGCGTGQFLLIARKNGWNASGVEVSGDICRWSRDNFNLDVRCGEFIKMHLNDGYFDVVTMFESLEHLDQPGIYLNKVNLILRNKGLLFLTTPNFASLSRIILGKRWSVFSKEHLSYFSPVVLRALLENNGFKVTKLITKNISLFELRDSIQKYNDREKTILDQEEMRRDIEHSNILKIAKSVINSFLNLCKIGDSIWVFAEKVREIK